MKAKTTGFFFIIAPVAAVVTFFTLLTTNTQNPVINLKPSPTPKPTVTINDTKITVELANTPALRNKGLSGVEKLDPNSGMLFVFDSLNTRPKFWLKGMLIPIDIIWINDNQITQIDKTLEPPENPNDTSNLKYYLPHDEVDFVLEVPGGFSDDHNLQTGDELIISY